MVEGKDANNRQAVAISIILDAAMINNQTQYHPLKL